METSYNHSMLEILPDEILLEVCRYLLCADILQAFFGLNSRITRMISQYCHHVSFHKASITQFSYLCINIIPHIGVHIRSLLIDCCYSVLQDDLFTKYFVNKMSTMFPYLEKISLVMFQNDRLIGFLNSLYNLNYLVELRLYELFEIEKDQQTTVLQKLMQANNHQLTSVIIDAESSCLSFNQNDCFVNILQLRINIKTVTDLTFLSAAVPNVRYLDVRIQMREEGSGDFDKVIISPLLYLTNFRLKSTARRWMLEELLVLLSQLSIVEHLSFLLSTNDIRLVQGHTVLPLLPSTVTQFHYAIYYAEDAQPGQDKIIISTWPSSHPVTCIFTDNLFFLHTLPWHFERMVLSTPIAKTISSQTNRTAGYGRQIETLDFEVNRNFTLPQSLALISQCRRLRKIRIWIESSDDAVPENQQSIPCLAKLCRLTQVFLYGSKLPDLNHLSLLFIAAPNLFRLDLTIDCLMKLYENQQMCDLLRQRITSISIYNTSNSSEVTLNEKHIVLIASTFTRLRDLYVDLTHLPRSTGIISDTDVSKDSAIPILPIDSCQQKCETVTPFSTESAILCLLTEFKEHKLISFCAGGRFHEQIESDAKKWLQDNTRLEGVRFDAMFMKELEQLFVWM